MSVRDLHYEVQKWEISCTQNQIQNWIKDLICQTKGKYSHLKFLPDDINKNKNRLWCRTFDEVNELAIFMTDLHEDFLINADIWLIDGTFRTTPKGFNQIVNIMGVNTM